MTIEGMNHSNFLPFFSGLQSWCFLVPPDNWSGGQTTDSIIRALIGWQVPEKSCMTWTNEGLSKNLENAALIGGFQQSGYFCKAGTMESSVGNGKHYCTILA